MWKAVASNALTLFIVILVGVAGLLAWGKHQFEGPGPLTESVCFQVAERARLAEVSRGLETQGVITDARIFRIGTDYSGRAQQLKAGSYLLMPGASMDSIMTELTGSGRSTCGAEINYRIGVAMADVVLRNMDPATQSIVEVAKFDPATDPVPAEYTAALENSATRLRVTLAEGTTVWQAVEALKGIDILTDAPGALPPEGTLAPGSYDVARGGSRTALLAEMSARQTRLLDDLWAARDEGLPYATKEEALIMASIVEKETGVAEERRQVASVFVNRLRQGMKLQTDPTVIYGVTKGQGVLGRGLRQSELRGATPWNTYVIDGLPPTPIANPGRESILATLNPDDTPYIFFVADGSGGHAFAVTLQEHNANVAKWRQIEAERARQQPSGN